ncbi:flavin reductase family protein [Mesorhizobium kowhaii]|uniref:flavin reductase family protein n=1 Tax=Mesorhizobium kowhaii TaxID=1300272 RepID=UPI0035E70C0C
MTMHQIPSELESTFKVAMRRLTAAVNIITTSEGDVRHGITATAVTSVSTSPPSALVCINKSTSIHDPIVRQGRFCVNVLACEHLEIVGLFSGKAKGEDRFHLGHWSADGDGTPYLADAQANLFAVVEQTIAYGTHTIFIGKIEGIRTTGDVEPLLYQDGGLCRAASIQGL